MKARPFLSGLISGIIGFLGTFVWGIWTLSQGVSSTTAVGYFFLPFVALIVAVKFGVFGYCAHYAVKKTASRRRRILAFLIALALLFSFLYWLGSALISCKVVREVRTLDREGVSRFLETSPFKANKFALNAILERQDIDAQTLYKIAQIPSPELHKRMGSAFPVMGKNRKGLAVMRLVAKHPNVDAKTLALLTNSPDDYVLGDVAANPKTPPECLAKLIQKGGQLVDWGLARNPNTPPEALHDLAFSVKKYQGSGLQFTRADVAKNKATSLVDLEKLSKDPDWLVRDSVLMNPRCSPALRESLRNDPDERIRRRFKYR